MTTITPPRLTAVRRQTASVAASSLVDSDVLRALDESASRRLVRAAERRRQRVVTVACSILVGLGATGTLAFASLLVAGH
ncbi:hypothetical protein EDF46_0033 [Frondihabitans sp. PhB188]|uniref:hypothetical protein n=1 Tax=Frondihabitans sp. PhB188 TaxID=2485200 RepID=UPI000FBB8C4E|nr:hypothetical protein [Frondihabitans sp. PhB188]ROQ40674.1 hypothetical protein EDF46_0033 [Frondihabitans sp. PhB188]